MTLLNGSLSRFSSLMIMMRLLNIASDNENFTFMWCSLFPQTRYKLQSNGDVTSGVKESALPKFKSGIF